MRIDETTFETLAEATLRRWSEAIEDSASDMVDSELNGGVLTLDMEDGSGTFVLSKHAPLRQLWLSSPLSGASHYQYDGEQRRWISTRDGRDLAEVLAADLTRAAGTSISLD